MKKFIEPNITIIIHKNSGDTYLYPSARKARIFANGEARKLIHRGIAITLRVTYGFGLTKQGKKEVFDNEITTLNCNDLNWALDAFLDRDLLLSNL